MVKDGVMEYDPILPILGQEIEVDRLESLLIGMDLHALKITLQSREPETVVLTWRPIACPTAASDLALTDHHWFQLLPHVELVTLGVPESHRAPDLGVRGGHSQSPRIWSS
jgi:hypothetical protein